MIFLAPSLSRAQSPKFRQTFRLWAKIVSLNCQKLPVNFSHVLINSIKSWCLDRSACCSQNRACCCVPPYLRPCCSSYNALPAIAVTRLTPAFLEHPLLWELPWPCALDPGLVRVPALDPRPASSPAPEHNCQCASLSPRTCWAPQGAPSKGLADSKYSTNVCWISKYMIIITDTYWAFTICLSLF